MKFPIQIQADNADARDAYDCVMCIVSDAKGYHGAINAFSKVYCHVVAWDADGDEVYVYDNR